MQNANPNGNKNAKNMTPTHIILDPRHGQRRRVKRPPSLEPVFPVVPRRRVLAEAGEDALELFAEGAFTLGGSGRRRG